MSLIIQLLCIFFLSLACTGFSLFLDFCFRDGNILGGVYRWLDKRFGATRLMKPLGACIFCANMWHGIISFVIIVLFTGISPWLFLPYSMLSHFSLRIFLGEK
jgi:hypothetical protein